MTPRMPALVLSVAMGLYSVAVCSPTPDASPSSPPPTWLSANQFVEARFAESVTPMIPKIREELKQIYPNAKSDMGSIDWETAKFAIEAAGPPKVSYYASNWVLDRDGSVAAPTFRTVEAEVFFNCTEQDETRKLTSSDVHAKEQETTTTRSTQATNRVKTSVQLTNTPPGVSGSFRGASMSVSGGLGGSLAKEWEDTVTKSDEFVTHTTGSSSEIYGTETDVTVPKMSLRFHEYRVRSDAERYIISADAVIDVPVRAVFVRPGFSPLKGGFQLRMPAKKFAFDLGQWSYYVPPQERTIEQPAIVIIKREMVFVGPTEVKFGNADQCLTARKKLESNKAHVADLIKAVTELNPVSIEAK